MGLILSHPAVATRDCSDCQRHIYDHASGQRLSDRHGQPIARPAGTFAPCHYGSNDFEPCAKGSPEAGRDLSIRNQQAYLHYLECRAVGLFPDDAIVRRNAALIQHAERIHADERMQALLALFEVELF